MKNGIKTHFSLQELDIKLRDSAADYKLSQPEKEELRDIGEIISVDQRNYLRNKALDITAEIIRKNTEHAELAIIWLSQVLKTIDRQPPFEPNYVISAFSPGNDCLDQILTECKKAKKSIDICVFTISENQISNELIACHKRGVKIRIITDDDKSHDKGSDIEYLSEQGIEITTDNSPAHMHHKFAIFDNNRLLNGSFNWTNSATKFNSENIIVLNHVETVKKFQHEFDKLWEKFKQ